MACCLCVYLHLSWIPSVPPQCTVLLDITTTPAPTAVSAAQQEPTSLSLDRTTASPAQGTPPLTLMVPPMCPTAKVMLLNCCQTLPLLYRNDLYCKVLILLCPQTSCVEVSWENTQATLSHRTTQGIIHPMWTVSGPSTHHTRGGFSLWYQKSSSPSRMSVAMCSSWGRVVRGYLLQSHITSV